MNPCALPSGQIVENIGWISRELCAAIKSDLAYGWWRRSELTFVDGAGRQQARVSTRRTSSTCGEDWMVPELRSVLRKLEIRLARRFHLVSAYLEPWQAVRYRRGEHFDEHHDAGLFAASPEGERTVSLLLYLDDHERGGATYFPSLDRRVRPSAGTLVLWRNLLDDGALDPRMRHVGLPPTRTKTVLVTWAREQPFRDRGKRRQGHGETHQ